MSRQRALAAVYLQPTDRIPQMECLQHPEFERALTGIDPYQHPQKARLAMLEELDLDLFFAGVPGTDDPIENPFSDGASSRSGRGTEPLMPQICTDITDPVCALAWRGGADQCHQRHQ